MLSFSRDDKRYTEKKNRSERARRKKEDIARLRTLVDIALANDPRIKLIKQKEKDARAAKKKGGKPLEDAKKKAEEDRIAKLSAAEQQKVRARPHNTASPPPFRPPANLALSTPSSPLPFPHTHTHRAIRSPRDVRRASRSRWRTDEMSRPTD